MIDAMAKRLMAPIDRRNPPRRRFMRCLAAFFVLIAGCGGNSAPGGTVWRLDASSGAELVDVRVGGHPCALAAGRGAAWVTDIDPGALYRVTGRASRAAAL